MCRNYVNFEKGIIIEFIRQEDFKYLRALGVLYIRLTFDSGEIPKYLHPLYKDFRKLRMMDRMGNFSILHIDSLIDLLLREDQMCDIQLPRWVPKLDDDALNERIENILD